MGKIVMKQPVTTTINVSDEHAKPLQRFLNTYYERSFWRFVDCDGHWQLITNRRIADIANAFIKGRLSVELSDFGKYFSD